MKLTAAQERILTEAKREIDEARACETFEDYFYKTNPYWRRYYSYDEALIKIREHDKKNGYYSDLFENYKRGVVLVKANTKTISKLEELGYIKIIEVGGKYNDWIEVIGY